ncbi:tigger transposable element-derived protein 1-like [Corythoichthys intestinalis]|uniref:tigger transposable element-derived protein 1-like n=1 Tax=Corythoichthys intestinalis TaxID=161448 RepID=UPI0025A5D9D2|nr:tigger transposable element-derived protein 1-like [Corythoichthys intestinalis]
MRTLYRSRVVMKELSRKSNLSIYKSIYVPTLTYASQYQYAKSTIATILKNKEAIKGACVAKGVSVLSKQRSQAIEDVEKLLLIWINEKQLAGDSVSEGIIGEKARQLHSDIIKRQPGNSSSIDDFKASHGWFEKFKRRTGIHSVIRHGEAASSDDKAAEAYKELFLKMVEEEGYVPHQVFNADETGLFWKKMPNRTFITQEEKSVPGHKPMKDRLTLLMCANASGDSHPPSLEEELQGDLEFIKVKFLPPNTTPLLQPMDQQVIASFKKLYTKALFTRCFPVTNDTDLSLRDYWKDHFNVYHCIQLIEKAWHDVTFRTLKAAWKKLWPACILERDVEGFDPQDYVVVNDIVSMGQNMGLQVDADDVEELVADHNEVLNTEDLIRLQEEKQKEAIQELSSEDEEEEMAAASSESIKTMLAKWSDVQAFIEQYHSEKTVAMRIINMMNDNVMLQFRKTLQLRKQQVSIKRFLVSKKDKESPSKKQRRQATPEVQFPTNPLEGDSPSKQ